MKIVLWPTHYLPNIGGLEVMTHSLAKELRKQGHEVIVITNNIESDEFKEFSIDDIKIYTFPFVTALHRVKLGLMRKIMDRVEFIVNDFSADLVNVHGWFECFCFYQTRVIAKTKIPLCITIHGLLEQSHYDTLECKKLWGLAKAINTVSQALIDSLEKSRLKHQGLRVIHNGLAASQTPIKPLLHAPPTLVMAGRLTSEKCYNIGFYALAELIKKHPDIKLILVGGGFDFDKLRALRAELKLEQHVEMTDFVRPEKVQEYMDQATIILVPSHYESFGLVALEAALRARPVVASDVYGLREVIAHNETGVLVPPQDPTRLAEAVDRLLSQPETLHEMGTKAHERARRLFTIEKTTESYIQMYQNIMEQ